jgi:hypothetical protein
LNLDHSDDVLSKFTQSGEIFFFDV